MDPAHLVRTVRTVERNCIAVRTLTYQMKGNVTGQTIADCLLAIANCQLAGCPR